MPQRSRYTILRLIFYIDNRNTIEKIDNKLRTFDKTSLWFVISNVILKSIATEHIFICKIKKMEDCLKVTINFSIDYEKNSIFFTLMKFLPNSALVPA